MNILLVEDNPGDMQLVREALEERAANIVLLWVKDGIEALEFLNHKGRYPDSPPVDLILLDLNLPKMPGHEVLVAIKTHENLKRIPVVILTSSSARQDVLDSYDAHANSYLLKSAQLETFGTMIDKLQEYWLRLSVLPPSAQPDQHGERS